MDERTNVRPAAGYIIDRVFSVESRARMVNVMCDTLIVPRKSGFGLNEG